MTAPVGAAPSMLRPGRRALTFPRATLKARIAHGPLGYPLSSTLSSVLSSPFSVLFPGPLSRQTPRRSSQGVRKHLSDPAPISLLFHDLRVSRPQLSGAPRRSRPRTLPLCRGSGARTGARSQGGASLTSATPAPLAVGACASRTRGWLLSPARRTCFLCGMGARTVLDGVLFVRVRPVG